MCAQIQGPDTIGSLEESGVERRSVWRSSIKERWRAMSTRRTLQLSTPMLGETSEKKAGAHIGLS